MSELEREKKIDVYGNRCACALAPPRTLVGGRDLCMLQLQQDGWKPRTPLTTLQPGARAQSPSTCVQCVHGRFMQVSSCKC